MAETSLTSLKYAPGIQKDGTQFQDQFCRDGQWVRFYRGNIRKMGGMYCPVYFASTGGDPTDIPWANTVTSISVFPSFAASNNLTLVLISDGDNIGTYHINSTDWSGTQVDYSSRISEINPDVTNNFIQTDLVIQGEDQIVTLFVNKSFENIHDQTKGFLVLYKFGADGVLVNPNPEISIEGLRDEISGGFVYVDPYLFVYGEKGVVQFSSPTNSFEFREEVAGEATGAGFLRISHDKVVHGASIRGGAYSPALIFWTLSKVIRVINVSQSGLTLVVETISNNSSILSNRSVVEDDGIFYWAGTDGFYFYNGVVREIPNALNLDYFFENINFKYRQRVFGVKNRQYGEIWWFYPDNNSSNGDPNQVIIYNIKENCWYNTAIERNAGFFSEDLGFMFTVGKPLVPEVGLNSFWLHDPLPYVTNALGSPGADFHQIYPDPIEGGLAFDPIESSITMPIISEAAFASLSSAGGQSESSKKVDRFLSLTTLEPDILWRTSSLDAGTMTFKLLTSRYPQSVEKEGEARTITSTTTNIDIRVEARNLSFKFESTSFFEMGNIVLSLEIGAGN